MCCDIHIECARRLSESLSSQQQCGNDELDHFVAMIVEVVLSGCCDLVKGGRKMNVDKLQA